MRTIQLFLFTFLMYLSSNSLSWSTNPRITFNENHQVEQAVSSTETTESSINSSFWISVDDDTKTFCDDTAATFDLSIHSLISFNGTITLSTAGPSSNTTSSFSNTTITNQGNSILTIQNLDVLEPDVYTFDVVATSGSDTYTISLNLIVKPSFISDQVYTNAYGFFNSLYPEFQIWTYNQSAFGIDEYEIDVSKDDSFNDIVFSVITSNNFIHVNTELDAGEPYYLRIRGMNNCTIGNYNYYNFHTKWVNCTNFFYNTTQYTINSTSPSTVQSQVNIPTGYINPFPVDDINVYVQLDHSNLSDLTLKLISPAGNEIVLLDGACNGFQNMDVTFDGKGNDYNCDSSGQVAIQGIVSPQDFFYTIDDLPVGNWTLKVIDNVPGNGGVLKSFGLDVCTEAIISTESFNETDFNIYPNPAEETVFVQNSSNQSLKQIEFVNVSGKLVKSISTSLDTKVQQIDVSDLQSGMYFVKFNVYNKSFVKKLIVK